MKVLNWNSHKDHNLISLPKECPNVDHNILDLEGPISLASISMSVSLYGAFCWCVKSLVATSVPVVEMSLLSRASK